MVDALVRDASRRYRQAGHFPYHFARFKLRRDPVFRIALAAGLIPDGARILDLGCGQGLLAAWLLASQRHDGPAWPAHWHRPPRPRALVGIELTDTDVALARTALAGATDWPIDIVQGDIRAMPQGAYDHVVMLDVLHYLDYAGQEAVLRHVHASLAPQGSVLLRVGDAGAGLQARYSQAVDRTVQWLRARRATPLYCRRADDWRALLARQGFALREIPLPAEAHGANVLMVAHRAEGP
jgi:SAM-dependent methyltransferase